MRFDALPYAAYGSNLWHAQMAERCPGAEVRGAVTLPDWRLVLRKYALVEQAGGADLPIGLWRVTAEHLRILDIKEGKHTYARRRIALPGVGEAWIYHEILRREGPPAAEYVQRLRHGYRDFGFDPSPLEAAIAASGFVA